MCFFILQKLCWLFVGHCLREVFQTLHDHNFALGLAVHTRFDDLDLILRPQVCQNHKVQIGLLILVHCSENSIWLLHTLKRSSTGCFV